jgi:ankyrin repeat protein
MARLLLEHGADLVQYDKLDRPGESAIHVARSAEMVQLLLDHHADPDQEVLCNKHRPLHYYMERCNIGPMKLLLEHGADVKIRGYRGDTLLHTAARAGMTDVVRLLLERWPETTREKVVCGDTQLHLAAAAGNTDVVRLLVERWPEGLGERNHYGDTPLHFAAQAGKTDMVGLLLEFWPDGIRAKDRQENAVAFGSRSGQDRRGKTIAGTLARSHEGE